MTRHQADAMAYALALAVGLVFLGVQLVDLRHAHRDDVGEVIAIIPEP